MLRTLFSLLIICVAGDVAHAEDAGAINVIAYNLSVTVDPTAKMVTGRQTSRLQMRETSRELSFTDNALEVVSAEVADQPVAVLRGKGRLNFVLPTSAPAGQGFRHLHDRGLEGTALGQGCLRP